MWLRYLANCLPLGGKKWDSHFHHTRVPLGHAEIGNYETASKVTKAPRMRHNGKPNIQKTYLRILVFFGNRTRSNSKSSNECCFGNFSLNEIAIRCLVHMPCMCRSPHCCCTMKSKNKQAPQIDTCYRCVSAVAAALPSLLLHCCLGPAACPIAMGP